MLEHASLEPLDVGPRPIPVGDVLRQLLAEAAKVRLDLVLRTGMLADKAGSHADEHPVFLGHALQHVDRAEATVGQGPGKLGCIDTRSVFVCRSLSVVGTSAGLITMEWTPRLVNSQWIQKPK